MGACYHRNSYVIKAASVETGKPIVLNAKKRYSTSPDFSVCVTRTPSTDEIEENVTQAKVEKIIDSNEGTIICLRKGTFSKKPILSKLMERVQYKRQVKL